MISSYFNGRIQGESANSLSTYLDARSQHHNSLSLLLIGSACSILKSFTYSIYIFEYLLSLPPCFIKNTFFTQAEI